jgi:hypothetical protein
MGRVVVYDDDSDREYYDDYYAELDAVDPWRDAGPEYGVFESDIQEKLEAHRRGDHFRCYHGPDWRWPETIPGFLQLEQKLSAALAAEGFLWAHFGENVQGGLFVVYLSLSHTTRPHVRPHLEDALICMEGGYRTETTPVGVREWDELFGEIANFVRCNSLGRYGRILSEKCQIPTGGTL